MKKILAAILCAVLSMALAGCGKPANVGAIKWFDCLNGDEMAWGEVREYRLEDFPGVTFRWQEGRLEAVTEKETVTLYTGMPIWSVYFSDVTGDGHPEICSTISLGSGIIDERIVVCDYAGGASYELADRGNFDYTLNIQGGTLVAEKRGYGQEEVVESGELVILDDAIGMKTEG